MDAHSIDRRAFRDALGHYASGITIISGLLDGTPVGFTCQSFYSVSIDPPLVSFSVMKTSSSWPKIRPLTDFSINLLSWDQLEVSDTFGRSSVDRWANVKWTQSPHGNPIIDDALVWLDCSLFAEHEAGDHWIVICNVKNIASPSDDKNRLPLLFYKGRYCQLIAS